mmetsp:Transcript_5636/g.5835  ORF Transcript_5636/g.5835 Transcript_5636/m.5835 type:complete len:326 (+) Transcript_5636:83-1060(+)
MATTASSSDWTIIDADSDFDTEEQEHYSIEKTVLLNDGICYDKSEPIKDQPMALERENVINKENSIINSQPNSLGQVQSLESIGISTEAEAMKTNLINLENECVYWKEKYESLESSIKSDMKSKENYLNDISYNRLLHICQIFPTKYTVDDSNLSFILQNQSLHTSMHDFIDLILQAVEKLFEKLSSSSNSFTSSHITPASLESSPTSLVSSIDTNTMTNTTDNASNTTKISLSSFLINDIALFFPTPRGDFLAFHVGCPHHYLSEESKSLIGHDKHFRKQYVLGRIIFKEERIATSDCSPYRLPVGAIYYEVSVSSICVASDIK